MRREHEMSDLDDLTPASWLKFGQRNVLYVAFLTLVVPLALALNGRQVPGSGSLGGFTIALAVCGAVSACFFLVNAGLVVIDLSKGRRVAKALIGCILPLVCGCFLVLVRHMVL